MITFRKHVPLADSMEIDESRRHFIWLQLSTVQLLVTLGSHCSQGREIGTFKVQLLWPVWDACFRLRWITHQKAYQFLLPDYRPEWLAQMWMSIVFKVKLNMPVLNNCLISLNYLLGYVTFLYLYLVYKLRKTAWCLIYMI